MIIYTLFYSKMKNLVFVSQQNSLHHIKLPRVHPIIAQSLEIAGSSNRRGSRTVEPLQNNKAAVAWRQRVLFDTLPCSHRLRRFLLLSLSPQRPDSLTQWGAALFCMGMLTLVCAYSVSVGAYTCEHPSWV